MRSCCGVTLYYPSKEELNCICNYKEVFDFVYLFDNTDSDDSLKNRDFFSGNAKFIYFSNNKNQGLSVAYNKLCKEAISNGFNYICLFDQDSTILKEYLIKMIHYIRLDTIKDVAIYAPEIIFKPGNNSMQGTAKLVGIEVDWAISSGSFINLIAYRKTEGFDENYFIDRLDYDYCYRIRKLGYKVIRIKNIFLQQTLGEQNKVNFNKISQHGYLRNYYIFRNRLYFYLKKDEAWTLNVLKVSLLSLRHIGRVIIFENYKLKKIQMMVRGLSDFKAENMGNYRY